MRNFQYLLQSVVRLTFHEGNFTISDNADGTITITLEDERVGVRPLVRIVKWSRDHPEVEQPAIASTIPKMGVLFERPEIAENLAVSISRSISNMNVAWDLPDITKPIANATADESALFERPVVGENLAVSISRSISNMNVSWDFPDTAKRTTDATAGLNATYNYREKAETVDKVCKKENATFPNKTQEISEAVTNDCTSDKLGTKKAERDQRKFCFRRDGDKCSNCSVIKCPKCPFLHEDGRCFATGKECNRCNEIGHFERKCPLSMSGKPKAN